MIIFKLGNLGEFKDMFKKYFKYVNLKEIEYTAGINKNYVRKEAFWNANSDELAIEIFILGIKFEISKIL